MKHFAALFLVAVLAAPASAQEAPKDDMQDGLSLLEQGARLFFRGLADEMEPALKGLAENIEPAMRELLGLIDDFDAYEMPERLPNGDIIIRRKPADMPDTLPAPTLPAPNGEVEL